jgi:hypothetical protein
MSTHERILNLPDNKGLCLYNKHQLSNFYGFKRYKTLHSIACNLVETEEELQMLKDIKAKKVITNREMNNLINILGKPNDNLPSRISKKTVAFCFTYNLKNFSIQVKNSETLPENVRKAYQKNYYLTPKVLEHLIKEFGEPTYAFIPKKKDA